MKYLDLSYTTPERNLACDELLLELGESGLGDCDCLRLWVPPSPFVVVGYANKVETEVHADRCAQLGIPVRRRVSGGGTVVLTPGCLAYAVVLAVDALPELASITGTARYVLTRVAAAVETVIHRPVAIEGDSDLAVDGLKFAGNAQRRKKRCALFHGTLLLADEGALIQHLLPMPSKQPQYRQARPHQEFIRGLGVGAEELKTALRQALEAHEPAEPPPLDALDALAREKYATDSWNLRQ